MPVVNELPSIGGGAKKWIYKHGTEYYGGLVVGGNSGVTPTRIKYDDYYYMHGVGSSSMGSNGTSATDQKVDVTGYSKLGAVFRLLYSSGATSYMAIGIGNTRNLYDSTATKFLARGRESSTTLNNVKLEFDISDLSGEYYVGISVGSGTGVTWTVELTELYLIK